MGNNNNNNNDEGNDDSLRWTCCNDEQTLFILLYLAFTAIVVITLTTVVAKPLRLIAVFIHEMSHATAAWMTGGNVHSIQVYHNEGGVTQYSGGCRCCVIPAGYVGCSFWAMIFVILSGGRRTATFAAIVFAMALCIALCYTPNQTMVFLNLGYALLIIAFIFIEWFYYTPILQFVILFFGVFIGFAAIHDIHSDTIVRSVQGSDSYACYTEVCPMCPPRCVGLQWIILAIFFQCFGIWIALIQMSNECTDLGWFQCMYGSAGFDFDWDGLHMFADFDGFWDNGP